MEAVDLIGREYGGLGNREQVQGTRTRDASTGASTWGERRERKSGVELYPDLKHHEIVVPEQLHWLRKGDSTADGACPMHLKYSLRAFGKKYVLVLEKNVDLLPFDYSHRVWKDDKLEVKTLKRNCHYHGTVKGVEKVKFSLELLFYISIP
mgnify:CR=1 FL=1